MVSEALRRIRGRFSPEHQRGLLDGLNDDVSRLLARAVVALADDRPDDSRRFYAEMSARAREVYEAPHADNMSPVEASRRALHGELAITGLISAGEPDEAMELVIEMLQDPFLPDTSKAKVTKTLSFLDPTHNPEEDA